LKSSNLEGGADSSLLELSLVCDFAEVQPAAAALRSFLARQGCSPADASDCEIALVEGCNNAIKYAAGKGRLQAVEVGISCSAREIAITIEDNTPGFEWPVEAKLPLPDQEQGRGIFLIQAVMDEANYTTGSASNRLWMRKLRALESPPPPDRSR